MLLLLELFIVPSWQHHSLPEAAHSNKQDVCCHHGL